MLTSTKKVKSQNERINYETVRPIAVLHSINDS